jgi:hypothetical protein
MTTVIKVYGAAGRKAEWQKGTKAEAAGRKAEGRRGGQKADDRWERTSRRPPSALCPPPLHAIHKLYIPKYLLGAKKKQDGITLLAHYHLIMIGR